MQFEEPPKQTQEEQATDLEEEAPMNFTTKEPEEEKAEEEKVEEEKEEVVVAESKPDDEVKEASKEESGFGGIFSKQITPPPEPELAVEIVDPDQGTEYINNLCTECVRDLVFWFDFRLKPILGDDRAAQKTVAHVSISQSDTK